MIRAPSLAVRNSETAHIHDGNLGLHLIVLVEDRGLVSLCNNVIGDTWIKIQGELHVCDVLHQEPVRLESSKERAREEATVIAFMLTGL